MNLISWQDPSKKEELRLALSNEAIRADIESGILSSNKNTLKAIGSYEKSFSALRSLLELRGSRIILLVVKGGGIAHPIRMRYENNVFFLSGYYNYTKSWEGVLNAQVYDEGAFNTFLVADVDSLAEFFDGWGIV